MRLITFTVENFRRFVDRTSLKLHSDLIALVGPNEAGKSSVLDALALLGSNDEYSRSDQHRRSGVAPTLAWGFELDDDDKAALASVPEAGVLQRVVITKQPDGSRTLSMFPAYPVRTRDRRHVVRDLLGSFTSVAADQGVPVDEADSYERLLEDLSTAISADTSDFSNDTIASIEATAAAIETLDLGFSEEDATERNKVGKARRELIALRESLVQALRDLHRYEIRPNPGRQTIDILNARLPEMLLYSQVDRELHGAYDLEEVADNTPPALQHLCNLANLDLEALRGEILESLRADANTRLWTANNTLRDAFDKNWNQQKVALQFHIDGNTLSIQAISLTNQAAGFSEINERSDGMRWFASLLAFVNGRSSATILLVDEIETHLHYDAQADLVNVLATQELASKVIYTTHSFGCLPPDIGTGIRVVEPLDDTRSRLVNGFWRTGSRAGFSPLLTSLGAAAVSFTPSRYAVITEGPSDAALLPTLIRQSMDSTSPLGFQVVPGVSEVAAARCAGLQSEAGRVIFLVDGDPGGLANKAKLIKGGILPENILILAEKTVAEDGGEREIPLEVEDLVDAKIYLEAVNSEIRFWNADAPEVTAEDIGRTLRTKKLEAWCIEKNIDNPDKVAVADRVLDIALKSEPEKEEKSTIFQADRREFLRTLHKAIASRLAVA